MHSMFPQPQVFLWVTVEILQDIFHVGLSPLGTHNRGRHGRVYGCTSSRMHVMNHNWSATKQCLHPQSVSEISRRSVLSGDRSRQCGTLVLGDGGCYFCNTTKSCGASDENKVICIAKCDVFSGVCESIR